MSKTSIVFLTPIPPPYGGIANQAVLIVEQSKSSNSVEYHVVRCNPIRTTENPSSQKSLFSLWPLKLYHGLQAQLSRNFTDIILCNMNGDISFIRNVFVCYLLSLRHRIPFVIHLHASRRGFWRRRKTGGSRKPKSHLRMIHRIGYGIVNFLLKRAAAFSQLTAEIDQYYQSIGLRPATHIIPNAVVLRDPDTSTRKPGSFLFVGRLSAEKGFFDLLKALALLDNPDWSLDVLGSPVSSADDDFKEALLAAHPYRNRIRLHGTVKGDAKWKYFDSASFLVLPTHLEVFPNVILEAMASGLAVISTPTGEIESMLPENGRSLVQPGDVEALHSSIKDFIEHPDMVAEMGRSNLKKSREYGLDSVAKQFEQMLLSTLKNQRKH